MENINVQITNLLVYDKLNMLAAEFMLNPGTLINIAVERFVNDVQYFRDLRVLNEKLKSKR